MAAHQILLKSVTSQFVEVMIRDSTTGQGKTGIAFGSVAARYMREGAAANVSISVVSGTLGTYTSGGWVEVDATGTPGLYQFGVPNAAVLTGVEGVTLQFKISGAIDKNVRIILIDANLRDATRLGLAALPANAANATGGLGVLDANGNLPADVKRWLAAVPAALSANGLVQVMILRWLTDNAAGTPAALSTNGYLQTMLMRLLTDNAAGTPAALDANNFFKVDVEDWKGATAPAMSGDAFARLGAPNLATIAADIAAAKGDTAAIKVVTDKFLFDASNFVKSAAQSLAGYVAPDNTSIATILTGITTLLTRVPVEVAHNADMATLLARITGIVMLASSYVAPDNSDIITILADVVSLLGRTDPTAAIALIKAVTDKLNLMIQSNGSGDYLFDALALSLAPTGSGGGSAPTAAQISAVVTPDVAAALATAHGAGAWGPTGASGAFSVALTITDANSAATLHNVTVTVKNAAEGTTYDQKITDGAGLATFSLDAGTYHILVTPPTGYGSLAAQTLVVSANTTHTYSLTPVAVPSAGGGNALTLYGYEYAGDDTTPVANRSVKVALLDGPAFSGARTLEVVGKTYLTDAAGAWQAPVSRGKTYLIEIPAAGLSKTITVTADTGVTQVNIKDA